MACFCTCGSLTAGRLPAMVSTARIELSRMVEVAALLLMYLHVEDPLQHVDPMKAPVAMSHQYSSKLLKLACVLIETILLYWAAASCQPHQEA
jgi:hypothetical protein